MHPDTPQERVRRKVAADLVPLIAEAILRADKGSQHMKLEDLRSESSQYLYLDVARRLVSPLQRQARVQMVHQADAHQFASRDQEQQDVERQAREDVARYGRRSDDAPRFSVTRPGHCHICYQPTITDRVVLQLTPNIHAEAHGMCCAKDDTRFELVADFAYRLKESAR